MVCGDYLSAFYRARREEGPALVLVGIWSPWTIRKDLGRTRVLSGKPSGRSRNAEVRFDSKMSHRSPAADRGAKGR
jgi:hypothetical protein